MSGPVRRRRDGTVELDLEPAAVSVLRGVLTEMLDLLEPEEGPPPSDPLSAALAIGVSTAPPEDPALRRLLPDAYPDDPEASGDFRRYTELGLRERKRTAASTALASLPAEGEEPRGPLRLRHDVVLAWLGALNDARLALGTRLGVDEDWEATASRLSPDDPRQYAYAVYEFLTDVQELLVRALG
ncbi:uncharacterized protein DUF2017 [Motilibacter rhizosphaerae]|uniref:Uncharacterized protein DUF2017 n=1 Tax=Motilibacter rhizosphaerae TaxID=598652 RepID=A0A4Q7NSA3_9ACTN|nr:DUF2017 domain-containing protein [Motilibacter rhizosphaerae]RZS89971.1 uncharacterized protein DUF2017 [Motilibacter rhizosphaerae]